MSKFRERYDELIKQELQFQWDAEEYFIKKIKETGSNKIKFDEPLELSPFFFEDTVYPKIFLLGMEVVKTDDPEWPEAIYYNITPEVFDGSSMSFCLEDYADIADKLSLI